MLAQYGMSVDYEGGDGWTILDRMDSLITHGESRWLDWLDKRILCRSALPDESFMDRSSWLTGTLSSALISSSVLTLGMGGYV
ncbi:hypothetical protein PGTUg99_015583 [Puccinia graminis f. sp. tritici]|uniref:Uncharacterized protein n=1 Tax=Puccinia graminis f. sp. tritici TaxID=56615 RepID=A0A5B0NFY9_PUCGR|nr:hypothetical protein PGTUg99_015583 [Puccinia graminis f. sp. tritici]